MKLFKLKRKNIILVSLLAIAGFLGISSVAVNQATKDTPIAEKAQAITNNGTVFFSRPNWSPTPGDPKIHFYKGSSPTDVTMTWVGFNWYGEGIFKYTISAEQASNYDGFNLRFSQSGNTFTSKSAVTTVVNNRGYSFKSWNTWDTKEFDFTTWQAREVTFNYDGNGAHSGSVASATFYADISDPAYTIANNGFTKLGSNFTGWNTKPDGSGKSYSVNYTLTQADCDAFEDGETITLYAQWEDLSNGTLLINLVDGDNASWYNYYYWNGSTNSGWANNRYGTNLSNYGSHFYYYNPNFTPTSMILRNTNHVYKTSDISIPEGALEGKKYFQIYTSWETGKPSGEWKDFGVTIEFNGNGNTGGSMENQIAYANDSTTLNSNSFTKTGHSFAGWATSAGGEVVYANNAVLDEEFINGYLSEHGLSSSISLYAKWTANKYTVSYANGGHGSAPSSAQATYGTSFTPAAAITGVEGYTFNKWHGNNGTDYTASTAFTYNIAGNLTLTATWTAHKFTIAYDRNTGTGSTSSTTNVTYGSTSSLRSSDFTKDGHIFKEWNTRADGNGDSYSPGAITALQVNALYPGTNGGTRTLYAIWTSGEDAAATFASSFNSTIGGICASYNTNTKASFLSSWNSLESTYNNDLDSYVKYWLGATGRSNKASIVEMIGDGTSVLGKYDYVLSKYGYGTGEGNLHDFLGRTPSKAAIGLSPFSLFGGSENNFSTIIIIVSSSVALLSVTALSILVIRKRKSKED